MPQLDPKLAKIIQDRNQANLKNLKDDSKIDFRYAVIEYRGTKGAALLIGNHDANVERELRAVKPARGTIEIEKAELGGLTGDKGSLKIRSTLGPIAKKNVAKMIAEFSNKKITFAAPAAKTRQQKAAAYKAKQAARARVRDTRNAAAKTDTGPADS